MRLEKRKFHSRMHQIAFGGRAPPIPDGRAHSAPVSLAVLGRRKGEKEMRRVGQGRVREGKGNGPHLPYKNPGSASERVFTCCRTQRPRDASCHRHTWGSIS